MKMTRRGFLITSAAGTAALGFVPGCTISPPLFNHGVASGDPLSDRVILWTRVSPQGSPTSVTVRWSVATDPEMRTVVATGTAYAQSAFDYTVKVDATGLAANSTYYYQFVAEGWASPVGRTKTLPDGPVEQARFALVSCSNYPYGYFNAYGAISRRNDIDAVIHLGDYYYEYGEDEYGDGTPIDRMPTPLTEVRSLAEYRTRHALYKTDLQLQELHRQHPIICIWDDHEFADDAWRGGAGNHTAVDGDWSTRLAAALQAYWEWMPVRQPDASDGSRIYRQFQYGDLLDLVLLDTRLFGRDEQAASFTETSTIADPSRHMIGTVQEDFLRSALDDSMQRGAAWRLLGQQVILSQVLVTVPLLPPLAFNPDQWDGYTPARSRIFDLFDETGTNNLVVLTGDVHSSWAMELSRDPYSSSVYDPETSAGAFGVEFVCPSVTSPGVTDETLASAAEASQLLIQPHLRFIDLFHRGYMILDVDASRLQAEWYFTPIAQPSTSETFGKAFRVDAGTSRLVEVSTPSVAARGAAGPAPESLASRWLRGESGVRLDFA